MGNINIQMWYIFLDCDARYVMSMVNRQNILIKVKSQTRLKSIFIHRHLLLSCHMKRSWLDIRLHPVYHISHIQYLIN